MSRRLLQTTLALLPDAWKRKLGVHLHVPDARCSLTLLRRFGFLPTDVLDVGAFIGLRAQECLEIFPEAHTTCIEPQDRAQGELRILAASHPNVQVYRAILGAQVSPGVPFQDQGSGSSVLRSRPGTTSNQAYETIDALIREGSGLKMNLFPITLST